LVRERRNTRASSWDMLARSRLPNLDEKRLRTNSQVLTVFFFGVGLVVLQMKIDSLGNLHGAPPWLGLCERNALFGVYTTTWIGPTGKATGSGKIIT
jgi:hypothetical protein